MTDVTAETTLREPAHQVSPRAVTYWRLGAAIGAVVFVGLTIAAYVVIPMLTDSGRPWWATLLLGLLVVVEVAYVVAMPTIRYRVHRWEVTETAIHTRSGWISRETRIAPLSRVQTVDSQQGALMRLFRLSTLVVTTASAAGPLTIVGLDQEAARRVVADLVAITGASEGDAT
ncbi:PH domain-containing protein [Nocardioides sp. InS609-2]|uniref:PH domain-containing protein n=1 Tax=Nocardioides sp. InS609-2 TaxID=2760705 RepID=UPI0020BF4ED7|nr:PH domain-containing protein [Nocardioides sp. InS609-2]